jgi:hypothetical protein
MLERSWTFATLWNGSRASVLDSVVPPADRVVCGPELGHGVTNPS